MRKNGISFEGAPASMNSTIVVVDGFTSDDGGRTSSRDDRTDRRRRQNGHKQPRPGIEIRKIMTPVVKVLLFGLLLALVDVLYIIKHLEETETSQGDAIAAARRSPNNPQQSHISKHIKTITKNKGKKTQSTEELIAERGPIIKLIKDAGILFDPVADAELIGELPKWADVVEMYGPKPVIYGLKEGNCQRFQAQSDEGDHLIGTAGIFNTGTNLLSELLVQNCMMPKRMAKHGQISRGIRWQVPWGKHAPAGDKTYRKEHKTKKDWNIDAEEIMPMVAIRDPLVWLKSMCRHKYTARWGGFNKTATCPDFTMDDLKMTVKYDGFTRVYSSLLHLWNEYYQDYKNIDIPFLLIRFEDLVFHPEETTRTICECGGGKMYRPKFRYVVDSAKKGEAAHGAISQRTGYVDALIRYGTLSQRYEKWKSAASLEFVKDNIDMTILKMMQYPDIDPSWISRTPSPSDGATEAQ